MPKNHDDWKKDRISSAHAGRNPMVLAKMKSGFAVMGDTQFLPGYCVLLPSVEVSSLNDLDMQQRSDYLLDMSMIGDVIAEVCNPKRINYSIYGNTDTFLHAHIFPRYQWEGEEYMTKPVWNYSQKHWIDREYLYSEENHLVLREKLVECLYERLGFSQLY
jgi:diadenosine tetraphosphate (Ap4A) HIT family hydrolase